MLSAICCYYVILKNWTTELSQNLHFCNLNYCYPFPLSLLLAILLSCVQIMDKFFKKSAQNECFSETRTVLKIETKCLTPSRKSLQKQLQNLSSLLASRDVLPGEIFVPQWQKFHIDAVKSVQNQVRSSDWST